MVIIPYCMLQSSAMDPYDNIRKELGLTQEPNHPPPVVDKETETQPADTDKPDNKKKWKPPPGYFTNASREQRSIARVLKENPNYSKEEARDIAKSQKKPRWKPPADYFHKDGFIERQKRKMLKIDPTTNSDTIHIKANEAYEKHKEAQKAKSKNRRDEFRKTKQYVKSFDSDLAKSMQIYYPNTKQAWIERRIGNLKKKYPQLEPSEIHKNAQNQYLHKLERENFNRRKRKAKRAENKHNSAS